MPPRAASGIAIWILHLPSSPVLYAVAAGCVVVAGPQPDLYGTKSNRFLARNVQGHAAISHFQSPIGNGAGRNG